MPDYLNKRADDTNELQGKKTNLMDIPIEDVGMKKRIINCIENVIDYEDWINCELYRICIDINPFEKKLFYVCLKLYRALDTIFSKTFSYAQLKKAINQLTINEKTIYYIKKGLEHEDYRTITKDTLKERFEEDGIKRDQAITPLIRALQKQIINNQFGDDFIKNELIFEMYYRRRSLYNYMSYIRHVFEGESNVVCLHELENNFRALYKYISFLEKNDLVSAKDIENVTKGAFSSIKTACVFYSKFTPSYYLYLYSEAMMKQEKHIPFLFYAKAKLMHFFSCRPVESFKDLNNCLSKLYDFLEMYSAAREAQIDSFYLDRIVDGMMINWTLIANTFSTIKTPNKVDEKEQNRRTKTSETVRDKNADRRLKLDGILENIRNLIQEEKQRTKKKRIKGDFYRKCFDDYKSELEECGITSPDKLQIKLSRKKMNKARSAYANRFYINIQYDDKFQDSIKYLYSEFKESERTT